jgi:hypothetical protein
MPSPIDRFIPQADVRKRHEIVVLAPAALVLQTARTFDMLSIPPVAAIFWLRAKMLGAKTPLRPWTRGLIEEALRMGWGLLAEENGRFIVMGAVCKPWVADVVFTPIPPAEFAAALPPGRVKIAWTLEAAALSETTTRFATETRAAATDAQARDTFRTYWRSFGAGILMIRWLLLPAVRRRAEQRWRAARAAAASWPPPPS